MVLALTAVIACIVSLPSGDHLPEQRGWSRPVRNQRKPSAWRIRTSRADAWRVQKARAGPIEEWVFFDHPSGRNRILAAMRWKAATLARVGPDPDGW